MKPNPENWKYKQEILVILAHPDDPEFFCGGMIARWVALGHHVSYCLMTAGQRGFKDESMNVMTMAGIRKQEQLEAAARLGVRNVKFLDHLDGELVPSIELREEIIKEIRATRPDIIVTCDPTNLFPAKNRINHPDHRAAGQAVLDAVFPAAGNPGYQFDAAPEANKPHQVKEVWMTVTQQPNFVISVTDYLDLKIAALMCHRSQVQATADELRNRYLSLYSDSDEKGNPDYRERFFRIIF